MDLETEIELTDAQDRVTYLECRMDDIKYEIDRMIEECDKDLADESLSMTGITMLKVRREIIQQVQARLKVHLADE